jgi:hypothetical protein
MRIRDVKNSDTGWKKVGSRINILDPQHYWYFTTVLPPHPVPNYALITDKTLQYVCVEGRGSKGGPVDQYLDTQ